MRVPIFTNVYTKKPVVGEKKWNIRVYKNIYSGAYILTKQVFFGIWRLFIAMMTGFFLTYCNELFQSQLTKKMNRKSGHVEYF